jgi:MFS family permease
LADVFDKRYVMALAILLQGLGMLALCQVKEMWVVFLFLLSFSPGFGGAMVLRGAIVREYFGRKSFGKMIGITMGYAAMGGIIGPTLAGWAFDALKSYYIVWLLYCILLVLASGMILKVR